MSTSNSSPPSYDSIANEIDSTYQQPGSQPQLRLDQHLHNRVTTFRADHVQEIISKSLLPIIQGRVERGLSRTSIALLFIDTAPTGTAAAGVPTNFSQLFTDTKTEDLTLTLKVVDIVSSHDLDLQHVQLTDPIDTSAFWAQPAVLNELRRSLRARLASNTDIVRSTPKPQPALLQMQSPPPPIQPPSPQQTQSRVRTFFARRTSSSKNQRKESSTQGPAGDSVLTSQMSDLFMIDIQPDEICLRVQNEFGLYQTSTRHAVIVRVRIRG